MKYRPLIWILFFGLGAAAQAIAPNSLSTTFVDVPLPPMPFDQDVVLHDAAGRDFVVMNGSSKPIRVEVSAEIPLLTECRGGAKPIPEATWLSQEPRILEIPAMSYREARIILRVPYERRYRGKSFQVMIRADRLPDPAANSIQIIQSLRVRVIFQMESKSK